MTAVKVGGLVDETSVCLGVYGENLDPDEVTRLLGHAPTSSHRRGEPRKSGAAWRRGAWLLEVRGWAPREPEELTLELLDRLPADESLWSTLAERYELQFRFAHHLAAWNRGFVLSPKLVARIATLHAAINFDIYADRPDSVEKPNPL